MRISIVLKTLYFHVKFCIYSPGINALRVLILLAHFSLKGFRPILNYVLSYIYSLRDFVFVNYVANWSPRSMNVVSALL